MTSFVGRGLAPAAILFGQSRTPVPTVKERLFVFSHTKKRCGVRDTVAVVVTGDFFASFFFA